MKVLGQEVPAHVVESAEQWMRAGRITFRATWLQTHLMDVWSELEGVRFCRRQALTATLASRLTQKHRKLGNLKCEGRVWTWVGAS